MRRLRKFWNTKKRGLILGLSALVSFSISGYYREESWFLLGLKIYAGVSMFIIVMSIAYILYKKRVWKQQKEQKFGGDRPDLIILDDVDVNKESVYTWVKRVILNVKSFLWGEGGRVPGLPDVPLPLLPGERILKKGVFTKSDGAYDQAVLLTALVAEKLGYKVGVYYEEDNKGPMIYIDLPDGQVVYRLPEYDIIAFLPMHEKEWNQYTIEEKRARIEDFLKYDIIAFLPMYKKE